VQDFLIHGFLQLFLYSGYSDSSTDHFNLIDVLIFKACLF